MEITFSKQDAGKIIYDSFCNGGLQELSFSSLEIDWKKTSNAQAYSDARQRLKCKENEGVCFEDVCLEILNCGGEIVFTDLEGDEDLALNLDNTLEKFNSLSNSEKLHLAKILDDDDLSVDACNYFEALQYALYGEVIFG